MNYTIVIIDDEFKTRQDTYKLLLEEPIDGVSTSFKIIGCTDIYSVRRLFDDNTHFDAVLLDARLADEKNDTSNWENYNFYRVLMELEKRLQKRQVIPLFMISKKWSEQPELLSRVSECCIDLKKILQPSMFYDYQYVEDICQDAMTQDIETRTRNTENVKKERENFIKAIDKCSNMAINLPEKKDIVIIIAVQAEKAATYKVFDMDVNGDDHLSQYGIKYQEKKIDGVSVVFVQQQTMGMSEAARVTTASIMAFNPKIVIMVGICAGDSEQTHLGNIIIPEKVYDYASGKIKCEKLGIFPSNEFISRSQVVEKDNKLEMFFNYINDVKNSEKIYAEIRAEYSQSGNLPEPDIHKKIEVSPMASGPWVVDSPTIFEAIKQYVDDKCLALDMEAYAVASTSKKYNIPWLIVKTVQDYANGDKSENEQNARGYAAWSSAEFIRKNIKNIITFLDEN